MKTVIEGVLSGALPWGLVGTGAAFSLGAMLCGLPGLAFAIGIYLPLATLTPIFVGGIVRRIVEARRQGPAPESDPGVLAASGMIAGEGLVGVMIAILLGTLKVEWFAKSAVGGFLTAIRFADHDLQRIGGLPGAIAGIAVVLALCVFLYRAGRAGQAPEAEPAA